ncbi:hypothetical protein J6590_086107 [Homalodisca vitripennis]|nr:hypothetical protein J6590_086107 [Homalodisca vitripennis]
MIDGVCLPGAKLFDFQNPEQISLRPGTRCEMLIDGTTDLAVGKQQNIYRHLETYITARSKDTEITVVVNAYIEELAIRYNIRVINFNEIGRMYFTRHGQHLSMQAIRILPKMIVGGLVLSGSASTTLETHSPPPLLVTTPAVAVSPTVLPTPAATHGYFCFTPRQSSGHQLLTYAEPFREPTRGRPCQPAPPQTQLRDAKINNRSPQTVF